MNTTQPHTPTLEARDIRRTYRLRKGPLREAVCNVDITLEAGERIALLGPNGSGKSTLMRILATADRPDQGVVKICSQGTNDNQRALRAARRSLGVVFQNIALDDLLTVRENLHMHGAMHDLPDKALAERIQTLAELVGVSDRLSDRVGTLSGGLKRRVDLARALLHQPRVLLLDEPTVGLDYGSRLAFTKLVLGDEPIDAGMSVLFSTHMMDEAELADRVVMLHEGKVVAHDSPDALRQQAGRWVVAQHAGDRQPSRRRVFNAQQDYEDHIRSLAQSGQAFEAGPASLGDAYLELTGTTLTDETGGDT